MITLHEIRLHVDGSRTMIPAKHKVFTFPGGEPHINFAPTASTQVAFVQGASPDDILTLGMWADACHRNGMKTIAAIPYLPAARADRGTPLGAKVYADIINSFGIDHVVALDPHSDVAPALYDRLTVVDIDRVVPARVYLGVNGIIAPDYGAQKRAIAVANLGGLPVFQASKKRDFATGKLSGFECERLPNDGNFLVVDDICDGGGTFLGLAEAIGIDRSHLSLWVTHGIFSKGTNDLSKKFHQIWCTDSFGVSSPLHLQSIPIFTTLVQAVEGKLGR